MSVETIIKLENVVKVFDNLEVIHNCNMNVPKGAIYGFVGANGAGKTTILNDHRLKPVGYRGLKTAV